MSIRQVQQIAGMKLLLTLVLFSVLALSAGRPRSDSPLNGDQISSERPPTLQEFDAVGRTQLNSDVSSFRYRKQEVTNGPCPAACHCYANVIVHCTNANLSVFPADLLPRPGEDPESHANVFPLPMQQLYLSFNAMEEIPSDALVRSGRYLENLVLSNNRIRRIQPRAFRGMFRLKTLDLSKNNIRSIVHAETNASRQAERRRSVFETLSRHLVALRLSHNEITKIPNRAFLHFRNLEVLALDHNRITWFGSRAFEGLSHLKSLHLSSNPLSPATVLMFSAILEWFSSGEDLVLSLGVSFEDECPTGPLADETISWRRKKRSLANRVGSDTHTSKTQPYEESVKVLDLSALGLASIPEILPATLKVLLLNDNKISAIQSSFLRRCKSLEVLTLARNRLPYLSAGSFRFNHQLLLLDLSSNLLNDLSPDTFCGLYQLETLRLHKNRQLTHLPKKVRHFLAFRYSLFTCGMLRKDPGPALAGAGPNARPRRGAPLSSGFITSSCSVSSAIRPW